MGNGDHKNPIPVNNVGHEKGKPRKVYSTIATCPFMPKQRSFHNRNTRGLNDPSKANTQVRLTGFIISRRAL